MILLEVLIKLCKWNFICWLMPSVIWRILLNCVIGEVDKVVIEIVKPEGHTRSSNIPILKPVSFEPTIETGHYDEATNIELSPFVEKCVTQIPLNNERTVWFLAVVDVFLDLFVGFQYFYSSTTITILTRLYDPGIIGMSA